MSLMKSKMVILSKLMVSITSILKKVANEQMFVQRNKSKSNAKNGLRVVLRENQESIVVQKLKLYQPAYVKRKLVVAILQMMVMFLVQQMSLMTWEMPF